jgi:hypothetical protein
MAMNIESFCDLEDFKKTTGDPARAARRHPAAGLRAHLYRRRKRI